MERSAEHTTFLWLNASKTARREKTYRDRLGQDAVFLEEHRQDRPPYKSYILGIDDSEDNRVWSHADLSARLPLYDHGSLSSLFAQSRIVKPEQ